MTGAEIWIVGAFIGAGTYIQYDAAKDAQKAQEQAARDQAEFNAKQLEERRKQAALEQKRADIENARKARTALREQRIAQATVANVAANTGASSSSALEGAMSTIGSQAASNLGYLGQTASIARSIGESNARIAQAQGTLNEQTLATGIATIGANRQAATGQMVSQLGSTFMSYGMRRQSGS